MTEREKRDAGLLYLPSALTGELQACKALCQTYNALPPVQTEERAALMRRILGHCSGNFYLEAPFWCDYGYNIQVGKDFYANHNCVILDGAKVIFGDRVLVGPDCGFYTACHPIDAKERASGLEYARPITVGDDVWFGGGVRVMPGVTIGSDVVIGAGSVVTRDIPSHVVAAGNPCRVLRSITPQDRML